MDGNLAFININAAVQMKTTRCILLLSVFISTFLHVSGNYVPIIRRTLLYTIVA